MLSGSLIPCGIVWSLWGLFLSFARVSFQYLHSRDSSASSLMCDLTRVSMECSRWLPITLHSDWCKFKMFFTFCELMKLLSWQPCHHSLPRSVDCPFMYMHPIPQQRLKQTPTSIYAARLCLVCIYFSHCLEIASRQNFRMTRGLTLSVSLLSGIRVLCCFLSNIWKQFHIACLIF